MTSKTLSRLDNIDALEAALTSDNPTVRGMARAAANGWPKQFEQWFNSERQRSGNNVDAFEVATLLFAQILASIMAHHVRPEGDEPTARATAELFRKLLPLYAAEVRTQIEPKAAAQ